MGPGGHLETCEGIFLRFPFHLIFLFWMSQCRGGTTSIWRKDEHPAEGRSASSKMPIAPLLRNTEERMKLEATVPSKGGELGQVAGIPLQERGIEKEYSTVRCEPQSTGLELQNKE